LSDANKLTDPRWRLNHLYKVVDKSASAVHFKENHVQGLLNADDCTRKKILKARQFGVSTNEILKQFDFTMANKNVTSVILAHEQDAIEKLFRIVRRAYDFFEKDFPDLAPELDRGGGSKYELFFPEINSRIYCDLESRGDTIHWLHASEVAFMERDRLDSTLQAVPISTGIATLETTPNGIGNHFYDEWNDPHSTFKSFFFPWYLHHEYRLETDLTPGDFTDSEIEFIGKALRLYKVHITPEQIAFRRFKMAELKSKFIQEYPEDDQSCFLSSGQSAMNLEIISGLIKDAPPPIEENDHLKIWERYDKNKNYVCGADPAEGKRQGDFCVASVFEVKSRRQVAQIRGRWKPGAFADEINKLCFRYVTGGRMHPLLVVERNNHGHAVLLELNEHINYPNLYFHKRDDGGDDDLGFLSNKTTRPILVDTFIDGVESRTIELRDKETLGECLTLVENNGKIEAAEGKHDDCVIAAALALHGCKTSDVLSLYEDIGRKILV
jgi:hypothetical protein